MTLLHRMFRTLLPVLLAGFTLTTNAQSPSPETTGPYTVGRLSLELVDQKRDETFSDDPADKRRLLVDVYYPATTTTGASRAPYASPALMDVFKFTDEQRAWTAPVYAEAAAADGQFPLLLFSPGLGNVSIYYSSLVHEVASQGYVVALLWHPYSTSVVAFADGTVVRRNDAGGVTGASLEAQMAELERLGAVWVADQRFVLNTLIDPATSPALLHAHIDSRRIGAFGHSFGGATAVQLAYEDARLQAAIDMDGTMFGNSASEGSRVPMLYFKSDPPPPTEEQLKQMGETQEQFDAIEQEELDTLNSTLAAGVDSRLIKFDSARHNAFYTDQLFYSKTWTQEQKETRIGNIEPEALFKAIHTTVTGFFELHLKR